GARRTARGHRGNVARGARWRGCGARRGPGEMTIAQFRVPPIVKTVTVRAPPTRAFALFADDLARWWPLSRVHTGPDPVDCAIEPRVGGRVFERAADGREPPWGTVLADDPPRRLAFFWLVHHVAARDRHVPDP